MTLDWSHVRKLKHPIQTTGLDVIFSGHGTFEYTGETIVPEGFEFWVLAPPGATIADARVQELLNIVLQFSSDDDWFGRRRLFATRERLGRHREELDDWEDRVKSAH